MTKIHFSKKRLRFTVLKLETSYFGFWLIMYQYTLFIKHLALNPFLKCFLDGRMIAKGAGFPVGLAYLQFPQSVPDNPTKFKKILFPKPFQLWPGLAGRHYLN